MQCLSSISIAAGQSFAPYTQPVYQRCITIIHTCLTQYQAFEQDPDNADEPDRTFIVVALDLLSGLTQGLGDQIHQLVASSQPPLLHLMALCLTVSLSILRRKVLLIGCSTSKRPSGNQLMHCSGTWQSHVSHF